MKAQELRIGNLILFEDEVIKVATIGKMAIGWGKSNFAATFLDSFKSIPLTEEWLEKSGAEKLQFGCIYIQDRFKLIWKEGYKYWYVVDYTDSTYLTKIEFVHEWQNFYFVMNGQELEIKDINLDKEE